MEPKVYLSGKFQNHKWERLLELFIYLRKKSLTSTQSEEGDGLLLEIKLNCIGVIRYRT